MSQSQGFRLNFQNKFLKNTSLTLLHPTSSSPTPTITYEDDVLKETLNLVSIIAYTDANANLTYVNDHFCSLSGYSRDELMGNNYRLLNSGFHSKDFFNQLWKMISTGQIWRGEIKNRKKDGAYYWVDTTIIPFPQYGPYMSSYLSIVNDITDKKEIQFKLEKERSSALSCAKRASLAEFAAGVSHELGNQIGIIMGRSELLQLAVENKHPHLTEYIQENIKIINTLMQRMSRIFKAMSISARDGTKDPFTIISLKSLVEDTIELGKAKYKKNNTTITLVCNTDDTYVDCREAQVSQILINLMNNAYDAIQSLSERWVKIELKSKARYVILSITDSGFGIEPHIAKNIFDPFFTTKQIGAGTGLGLSISKNLARDNGGDLIFDFSKHNTCFILTLLKNQNRSKRSLL